MRIWLHHESAELVESNGDRLGARGSLRRELMASGKAIIVLP
jgi:hypothetical protein